MTDTMCLVLKIQLDRNCSQFLVSVITAADLRLSGFFINSQQHKISKILDNTCKSVPNKSCMIVPKLVLFLSRDATKALKSVFNPNALPYIVHKNTPKYLTAQSALSFSILLYLYRSKRVAFFLFGSIIHEKHLKEIVKGTYEKNIIMFISCTFPTMPYCLYFKGSIECKIQYNQSVLIIM